MKRRASFWELLLLVVLVLGLYSFAGHRYHRRVVNDIEVKFLGDNSLYLTENAVNKMLIQNHGNVKNLPVDQIVLNTIEEEINANPMVENAQVFLTHTGSMVVQVRQRQPIGRVQTLVESFYLDQTGRKMPLSEQFTARVPLITGQVSEETLAAVHRILTEVQKDEFLLKNVIGIHIQAKDDYRVELRSEDYRLHLGNADRLAKKFQKFKAFYAQSQKLEGMRDYSKVSLEFRNQVVCTKNQEHGTN